MSLFSDFVNEGVQYMDDHGVQSLEATTLSLGENERALNLYIPQQFVLQNSKTIDKGEPQVENAYTSHSMMRV